MIEISWAITQFDVATCAILSEFALKLQFVTTLSLSFQGVRQLS